MYQGFVIPLFERVADRLTKKADFSYACYLGCLSALVFCTPLGWVVIPLIAVDLVLAMILGYRRSTAPLPPVPIVEDPLVVAERKFQQAAEAVESMDLDEDEKEALLESAKIARIKAVRRWMRGQSDA